MGVVIAAFVVTNAADWRKPLLLLLSAEMVRKCSRVPLNLEPDILEIDPPAVGRSAPSYRGSFEHTVLPCVMAEVSP